MGDFSNTTIIKKSRKDYRCEHCGLTIPKGRSYNRINGVFDNSFFDIKAHKECEAEYIRLNSDCENYEWGELSDFDEFAEIRNRISHLYNLGKAFDMNGNEIKKER